MCAVDYLLPVLCYVFIEVLTVFTGVYSARGLFPNLKLYMGDETNVPEELRQHIHYPGGLNTGMWTESIVVEEEGEWTREMVK